MSETPELDEYGYAPTKIVRVRTSRGGGAIRFVRVWMKPDDLDFPEQERPVTGEELERMRVRYAVRKLRGERMNVGIVMDAGQGAGGMPQNGEATEEGGTPAHEIFAQLQETFSPEDSTQIFLQIPEKKYLWHCPACHEQGEVDFAPTPGESPEGAALRLEGLADDQHIFSERGRSCMNESVVIALSPADFAEPIEPRGATRNFVHFDEEGQTSSPFIPENFVIGYDPGLEETEGRHDDSIADVTEEVRQWGPKVSRVDEQDHDGAGPIGSPLIPESPIRPGVVRADTLASQPSIEAGSGSNAPQRAFFAKPIHELPGYEEALARAEPARLQGDMEAAQ